jgi:hypothetical protein
MPTIELPGRFPPGAKVQVHLRASDSYSPGSAVVAQGQVGADTSLKLSSQKLVVGAQYWVSDGDRTLSVQVKDDSFNEDATLHRVGPEATARRLQADREAQAEARAKAEKTDPLAASPAPGRNETDNSPAKKTPSVAEPQPAPKQQEISGPQRSDTPDGTAVPKDPGEHVPDVPQEAVGKNTPQRSSTETGVATVKDLQETVPSARQEDVASSTPQRSSTPEGQAERKPPVKGAGVQKRDDSSANRARGRTRAKAEENVKGKAPVKETTRTGTPKRPAGKK